MNKQMTWKTLVGSLALVWLVIVLMFVVTAPAFADAVVLGNIDLDNRIVAVNEDGSFSTEKSFSVNIDGLEVLLPTVINGEVVSEEAAIEHFFETGEHLGMFETVEEAEAYAEALHLRQEKRYGKEI